MLCETSWNAKNIANENRRRVCTIEMGIAHRTLFSNVTYSNFNVSFNFPLNQCHNVYFYRHIATHIKPPTFFLLPFFFSFSLYLSLSRFCVIFCWPFFVRLYNSLLLFRMYLCFHVQSTFFFGSPNKLIDIFLARIFVRIVMYQW